MATYGGSIATGAATADTLTLSTGLLNVTGTDLCLVVGAANSITSALTYSFEWGPSPPGTRPQQAMTGSFGVVSSGGAYVSAEMEYLDDPTPANVDVECTFSTIVSDAVVWATFFTAAGNVVNTDVATDADASTSTGVSGTVGNVTTGDQVIDFVAVGNQVTLTADSPQEARLSALDSGSYLRVGVSTQDGSSGGAVGWTYSGVNYGASYIAGRIPGTGGGGPVGGGANFLTLLGVS